jgi:drug/metabolite transporter (DMT)-like permease
MMSVIARGAVAGAAGTAALNAATYLDMVVRGRPSSSTPARTVDRLAELAGVQVPGDGDRRSNRASGLGLLMGLGTGVAVGVGYALLRRFGWRPSVQEGGLMTAATAMAGSALPMTVLGVTDPRDWSIEDWISDVLPHLAFGLTTSAAYAAMDRPRPRYGRSALRILWRSVRKIMP